jgi:hypothetical protein
MKMSVIPKFKPDPMLSAEAAQRIMKKAEKPVTNPGADQVQESNGQSSIQQKAMGAAQTALEVAQFLPIGLKVKAAAVAGSFVLNKLRESDIAGPGSKSGDVNIKEQLDKVLDVSRSTPHNAAAQNPAEVMRLKEERLEMQENDYSDRGPSV